MSKNVIKVDLLKGGNIEVAAVEDADLMHIRCFATTEGVNENSVLFRRDLLSQCYKTFVDKPVVIVEDRNFRPTGHGFDFNTRQFDMDKRRYIGHINNAFPVVVDSEDKIHYLDGLELSEYPSGEYRIVTDIVVYKQYLSVITRELEFLHSIGKLNFSMEAYGQSEILDNGVRDYKSLVFTGLAIVSNPAFKNAKSIEVAEKEDGQMDFEKEYNDLKAKYDDLVVASNSNKEELDTQVAENGSLKQELSDTKESLANANVELANVKAEVEALKPFKEKVELAEKEALGKERAIKLAKFGVEVKEDKYLELAEMSKEDFADKLVEASDEYKPEVAEKQDDFIGVPQYNNSMNTDKDELIDILAEIVKTK